MATDLIRHVGKEQIVPGPLVSQDAAFAGLEKFTNKLAANARQFADEQSFQVAQQQGELAGQDPTFTPLPGVTKALQVFNKAALQSNKYAAGTEIDVKINEFLNEAKQNVSDQSLLDFSARLQGFTKGILESTPTANHGYIKNRINYQGGKSYQTLNNLLFQRNNAIIGAEFDDNFRSLENQMSNAAREGDFNAAHSFHGQLTNMMTDGLSGGLLTPGKFRAYSNQATKIINRENVIGQFMQNVDTDTGVEFIKNFQKDKTVDKEFSAVEKDALTKRMKGILKEKALASGVIAGGFVNTLKAEVMRVRGGVEPSPEQIGTILAAFPKRQSEIVNALELAHNYHEEIQSTTYSTNGEVQQRIQELGGSLTQEELEAPHPQQIVAHRVALANELTRQLNVRQKDPFLYASNTPLYQQEVDKEIQGLPADPQGIALRIQKAVGIPDNQRRLIDKNVAAGLKSTVISQPLDKGVGQLEELKAESGQNWKYIAPAIFTKDFPTKYPLMMGVINNPESRPFKNELIAALDTPQKVYNDLPKSVKNDVNNRVDSILRSFVSTTDSYPGNSLEITQGIRSNIRKVALWYTQNSSYNDSPQTAVERAYDVLVKNRYSEINERGYRVPFDIDAAEVRRTVNVKNLQLQALWEQDAIMPFRDTTTIKNPVLKAQVKEQDRREILNEGRWITNGANENELLYVSPRGVPVTLRDGSPFSINLRDMTFFDEDLLKFRDQVEKDEKRTKKVAQFVDQLGKTGLPLISPISSIFRR